MSFMFSRTIQRTRGSFSEDCVPVITYEAYHLDLSLLELILHLRECTQLSRAHGREVGRMREEDCPRSTEPVVEIDLAVGRLSLEIRRIGSES